jgi:hypothetical protein
MFSPDKYISQISMPVFPDFIQTLQICCCILTFTISHIHCPLTAITVLTHTKWLLHTSRIQDLSQSYHCINCLPTFHIYIQNNVSIRSQAVKLPSFTFYIRHDIPHPPEYMTNSFLLTHHLKDEGLSYNCA